MLMDSSWVHVEGVPWQQYVIDRLIKGYTVKAIKKQHCSI